MRRFILLTICAGSLFLASCSGKQDNDRDSSDVVGPDNYTLSKETTYITEPLDEDGRPDFRQAINQRASKGVTLLNNSAVKLWEASGPSRVKQTDRSDFFKLLGIAELPEKGNYFLAIDQYLSQEFPKLSADEVGKVYDDQTAATRAIWTKEKYPRIASWLNHNRNSLALVIQATGRDRYYSPLVGMNMGDRGLSNVRSFGRALTARSLLQGVPADAAWKDIMACRRLARLVAAGPGLANTLIGYTIDGMARRAMVIFLSDSQRTAAEMSLCMAELEKLEPPARVADCLNHFERLEMLSLFLRLPHGDTEPLEMILPSRDEDSPGKLLAKIVKDEAVDWDRVLRQFNKDIDELVAMAGSGDFAKATAAHKAKHEQRRALAATIRTSQDLRNYLDEASAKDQALAELISSGLSDFTLVTMFAAIREEARFRQATDLARVAVALRGFQLETGKYPATLQALVPKYLSDPPIDLFGKELLRYKLSADGYLLYSVGPDGKDDGGSSRNDAPDHRGDDMRIRLPIDDSSIWP